MQCKQPLVFLLFISNVYGYEINTTPCLQCPLYYWQRIWFALFAHGYKL
jgi:hypothetical protein